ncbi:SNF2/RAD54 HELICASE FAMILY [Salix koriyanagi]|uniref:SNF2/RAD54 HELICASE FAMILY n=1 Tax=Salix koriyanagi TaxID=2511006 RepID=A0A9Q0WJ76_9ROSI|nr:SNF2/RAD54 HELICASE FAMILY [Salix koriyanagi]
MTGWTSDRVWVCIARPSDRLSITIVCRCSILHSITRRINTFQSTTIISSDETLKTPLSDLPTPLISSSISIQCRPNCETPYKGRSKGLSLYHSQKVTEEEEFPMSSLGNSNNIFWQECPVSVDQNDLKELWSLLNLLLPEVFDNRKAFHDWFLKPFQREAPVHDGEDDWLETEKKVIIIHRLHQILEPFMLRRRVEDVEGSLPPKVSIVLRCRMSSIQSTIYDWIKSTGTIRVDPEDEKRRVQKNPAYQAKNYYKNSCCCSNFLSLYAAAGNKDEP